MIFDASALQSLKTSKLSLLWETAVSKKLILQSFGTGFWKIFLFHITMCITGSRDSLDKVSVSTSKDEQA